MQIARSLANATGVVGVVVLVEARHGAWRCGGAKQTHVETATSSTTGVLAGALGGSNLRHEEGCNK